MVVLFSCSENSGLFNILKPKVSLSERLNAAEVKSYEVKNDQSYGSDSFQKYDLHLPVYDGEIEGSVAMIVIHGGGWSLLDKSFMNGQVDEFKKMNKNVAIFNINHRLAGVNGYTYNSIIEDLDLLIQHINDKKSELNLSDEIVIYGYSSGGHLALEYSKLRSSNKNIKAVAASAPPTDLTSEKLRKTIVDDKNRNLIELLIGESYEANPNAYKEASPFYKVSKKSKPTLIFYGDNDQIVYNEQIQKYSKSLSDNKVENRLIVFNGVGHEMPEKRNEIAVQVFKFLEER